MLLFYKCEVNFCRFSRNRSLQLYRFLTHESNDGGNFLFLLKRHWYSLNTYLNKEKAGNILRWTKEKNTKQNWTSDFMAFYEDTWCQWKKKKTKDALPHITNKTLCIVFFCYFIFMDFYFEHIIPKFVKFIQNYTDFVYFISLLLLVYTIWTFSLKHLIYSIYKNIFIQGNILYTWISFILTEFRMI